MSETTVAFTIGLRSAAVGVLAGLVVAWIALLRTDGADAVAAFAGRGYLVLALLLPLSLAAAGWAEARGGESGWAQSLGNVQSQHWQFANRWGEGDWHHVAVSWTPEWYALFVDGLLS